MKYLKTFEEINFRNLLDRTKHGFKKKEKIDDSILSHKQDIEDCLNDLFDISKTTSQGYSGSGGNQDIIFYRFELRRPISEEQYEDYLLEIEGRVSDIDSKIIFNYRTWYSKQEKYLPPMEVVRIVLIFSYIKLSDKQIEKIVDPKVSHRRRDY